MSTKINNVLLATMFALAVPFGIAMAAGPVSISGQGDSAVASDKCTNKEQGLVRDRANYRATVLEEQRAEQQAKLELRKGAGLDRERAEMRARTLEERRLQQRIESAQNPLSQEQV